MTKKRGLQEGSLFQKKYRIGKKLGEGGMGVVYAAVQEPSGLPVAVKVISARELSARELQVERAFREARVLAKLSHNNIVRLYDFDQTPEGDCFIIMELVEGDTLQALITRARKQGTVLDLREALRFIVQAAEGVGAAHKAGVVHRDLKPDNLMVAVGGIVRVLDFGLAKNQALAAVLPNGVATSPANVPGTPRYMAPEQVRGEEVDARADVYALGVTLYEALTGRPPYEREGDVLGVTEIMGRHCYAKPTPLTDHLPSCPERVAKIVLQCLAKDPSARYQTARDLALDIRAVLAEEVQEEQARLAAERAHRPRLAASDVRETGPMSPQWSTGPVLPFVSAAHQPAAHVVRETIPIPARGGTGQPQQPTYAATPRGVGFTTKMPRPSESELALAEAQVRQSPAITAPDVGESKSATSGVHLRLLPSAEARAALERRSDPDTMSPQHAPGTRSQPVAERRLPPLYFAPVGGAVIALVALFVLMDVRAHGRHHPHAEPTTSASAAVGSVTASASTPAVSASTTEVTAPFLEATATPTAMEVPSAAPVSTSTAEAAASGRAATVAPRSRVSVSVAPKATATSAPSSDEPAPARRSGKKPITPPAWPADEATPQPKKRPITPPRPDDHDAKRSAPLFGVDQ